MALVPGAAAARAGAAGPVKLYSVGEGRYVMADRVVKSDEEWRELLTTDQYRIARNKGTEAPFCGTLLDNKRPGIYSCVCCGLPLFASLVAVPWLVLVAGLFRTYRSDIGAERGQQLVWGVIVLFVVVFIGLSVLLLRGVIHAWAPRALLGVAAHALGASPAGTAAAWLGTAVLIGLGFWLVERQFRRMEIPTRPLRFSLVYYPRE